MTWHRHSPVRFHAKLASGALLVLTKHAPDINWRLHRADGTREWEAVRIDGSLDPAAACEVAEETARERWPELFAG